MYILLLCGRRPPECGARLRGLLDVRPRREAEVRRTDMWRKRVESNSKAVEVQVVTALCWLNDVTALCTRLTTEASEAAERSEASEAGERASKLRGC